MTRGSPIGFVLTRVTLACYPLSIMLGLSYLHNLTMNRAYHSVYVVSISITLYNVIIMCITIAITEVVRYNYKYG